MGGSSASMEISATASDSVQSQITTPRSTIMSSFTQELKLQ